MENITIANISDEVISFRYFNVNLVEKLNPGDSVIITPSTTEALDYYNTIIKDCEGLSDEAESEDIKITTAFITKMVARANNELDLGWVIQDINIEDPSYATMNIKLENWDDTTFEVHITAYKDAEEDPISDILFERYRYSDGFRYHVETDEIIKVESPS